MKNHVYYHVWTQEEIAKAYDVGQTIVGYRINLHGLPDEVKGFTTQNLISERQLIDILPLSLEWYFQPWLTTDQIRMKCAEDLISIRERNLIMRLVPKVGTNLLKITNLRKDQNLNRST